MPKRLTTSEFIKKAKVVHGDKYDYSKVNYINNRIKVCIICPKHGEFWQTPNAHLNGEGCNKCGRILTKNKRSLTTNEFIEKAIKVHGNKYDYSKVNYINARTKVCIICPIHGEFWQTPTGHLIGRGCEKCGCTSQSKARRFTKEMWVEKAKKVHGDRYDYSKVEYVNSQTPIIITCPIHGDFKMRPNDHLRGQNCPKCKKTLLREKLSMTTNEFIERARAVHGDKYDYSKVNYINNRTEVCIICPKHGEFWQTPVKHLQGNNCPKCNSSKLEEKIRLLLLNNEINFKEQYHFNWFTNDKMKVDFFLLEYNVVIECQGIQHFKPVKRFGGIDGFKKTFINDKLKYEECKKNDVKIIYYTELGEYFSFLGEELVKSEKNLKEIIDKLILTEKDK